MMAFRDRFGRVTQTAQDARGGETSKDSYYVLLVSMVMAAVVGMALFWYFDVFAGPEQSLPRGAV